MQVTPRTCSLHAQLGAHRTRCPEEGQPFGFGGKQVRQSHEWWTRVKEIPGWGVHARKLATCPRNNKGWGTLCEAEEKRDFEKAYGNEINFRLNLLCAVHNKIQEKLGNK